MMFCLAPLIHPPAKGATPLLESPWQGCLVCTPSPNPSPSGRGVRVHFGTCGPQTPAHRVISSQPPFLGHGF
ncbi:hypothetical protein EBZ35_01970 [bacterium]|nr:hypothetical protein [bacterium]